MARTVSFSQNLEITVHIERLHASLIRDLHYQQEDYVRFRTEKFMEDIRQSRQDERQSDEEQKAKSEKIRRGRRRDSLDHMVQKRNFGTQQGAAQAA